jgi:hypothetical protein
MALYSERSRGDPMFAATIPQEKNFAKPIAPMSKSSSNQGLGIHERIGGRGRWEVRQGKEFHDETRTSKKCFPTPNERKRNNS